MKVIRWIQNLAAIAALVLALNLADESEISFKDSCTAGVLLVLSVAMMFGGALEVDWIVEFWVTKE